MCSSQGRYSPLRGLGPIFPRKRPLRGFFVPCAIPDRGILSDHRSKRLKIGYTWMEREKDGNFERMDHPWSMLQKVSKNGEI